MEVPVGAAGKPCAHHALAVVAVLHFFCHTGHGKGVFAAVYLIDDLVADGKFAEIGHIHGQEDSRLLRIVCYLAHLQPVDAALILHVVEDGVHIEISAPEILDHGFCIDRLPGLHHAHAVDGVQPGRKRSIVLHFGNVQVE